MHWREKKTRRRYYDHRPNCKLCGKLFYASRKDAAYCSCACRKRANRHRLNLQY